MKAKKRERSLRLLCLGVIAVGLTACGSSQDDLKQWMEQERSRARPRVQPIPEPTRFVPQNYMPLGLSDAFDVEKLNKALRLDSARPDTSWLVAPERARRKEPLESFPLDTMEMVGSLMQQGRLIALVKVNDLLYQVRPGNYLGENYGRVTRITEGDLTLREIVQDAAGEWIERTATLQLQENVK